MSHAFSTEVSALITKFGGISRIPSNLLAQYGQRCLTGPKGVSVLIPETEFKRLQDRALFILHEYRGYLFSEYLIRLRRFVEGREIVNIQDLTDIVNHASSLKEAGIPRIFESAFYHPTKAIKENNPDSIPDLFPSIDFVIQLVTGIFFRRAASLNIQWRSHGKVGPKPYPVQPTTTRDIYEFRRLAFTPEGKIDPVIIREVFDYISERLKKLENEQKAHIIERDHVVFLFLEEKLSILPVPDEYDYKAWDGSTEMVGQRFWFLRFSPEDRIKIVQRYAEQLPAVIQEKDRKIIKRLRLLFPEFSATTKGLAIPNPIEEEQRLEREIEEAFSAEDLSNFPRKALVEEPWRSRYLARVERFFRENCRRLALEKNGEIFNNAEFFHKHVPVPPRLALVPHFKAILDEERLVAAKKLSDEVFLDFFGNTKENLSRIAGIGRSRFYEEAAVSDELHQYLIERNRSLK